MLRIEVATSGAELSSIYHKNHKQEYLWQGSPDWWPRRSPVLFPIVGKLNANLYRMNGKIFSLPQHGFARDMEFKVGRRGTNTVEFVLESTEELLQKYPFPFELKIIYSLNGVQLYIHYEVKNEGLKHMYFSIGGHPGFALIPGETPADYYIEFEKAETLDRHLLQEGLFSGKSERVISNEKILGLNNDFFTKDALVFKNMKSSSLHMKSRKSDYAVKLTFAEFPYFGIWSKPGAAFLCLEPWCGLSDTQGFEGEFSAKEGIQSLEPGKTFLRSFSIEIES